MRHYRLFFNDFIVVMLLMRRLTTLAKIDLLTTARQQSLLTQLGLAMISHNLIATDRILT